MTTPWYLAPGVLLVIEKIIDEPPVIITHENIHDGEWQSYDSRWADMLDAWWVTEFNGNNAVSPHYNDVIAAATNTTLRGIHFRSDDERIAEIREKIMAALNPPSKEDEISAYLQAKCEELDLSALSIGAHRYKDGEQFIAAYAHRDGLVGNGDSIQSAILDLQRLICARGGGDQ